MSTATAANRIRDSARSARALRIVAAGTWLDAGGAVRAADSLSIADDRGIVEYVPGDLTLTARAGTPIVDLVTAVKGNDQWLPLDPWGGDRGTLGATLSTATAGPHSHAMGLPRDVALGIEFVSGTGEVIRAGGRVVKNVAGFDLTRLVIGAWGTLGLITEATLRLRARPAILRTFVLNVDRHADALNELAVRLRALPFTPLASELVNAALARHLGIGGDATLLVRLAGNANAVDAQAKALQAFGRLSDGPADVWKRLRECDRGAHATWRRSQSPSVFGATWTRMEHDTASLGGAFLHGNPARGVVRAAAKGGSDVLRACASGDARGTLALEVFPMNGLALPESAERRKSAVLERRLRDTFDPQRVLNPGIMGTEA